MFGTHPAEDQALVALKAGRNHVHPAVVGVVVPCPALGVAAVQPRGNLACLPMLIHDSPLSSDCQISVHHHVAETLVDDRVQVTGCRRPAAGRTG